MSNEIIKRKTSGWAVACFVFGIFSLTPFVGFILAPFALIFGVIAITKIAGNKEILKGMTFSCIGLFFCIISISIIALSVYDPRFRFRGDFIDEKAAEAKSYLRSMSTAAATYAATYRHKKYPLAAKDLTEAKPPYLKEMYCDTKKNGIYYKCEFKSDGYCFEANFIKMGESEPGSIAIDQRGYILETSCDVIQKSEIIKTSEYFLYVPSEIDKEKKNPLIVALSPHGRSAHSMILKLFDIAEKNKWIIFAYDKSGNGVPSENVDPDIARSLREVISNYPVDKDKVIVIGISKGGMIAHMFAAEYPDLASAVIVDNGIMDQSYIEQKKNYPKGRLAVFLVGRNKVRYDKMLSYKRSLDSLEWKTKWIEFESAWDIHIDEAYDKAVNWLIQQF